MGSLFLISEREREMHWSKLRVTQFGLFLAATLINQFLEPGMIDDQLQVKLTGKP
jgi:hypothetical protein